ncbi:uncharacterized protein LOC131156515 isoform X2 [Malania oleifera]|uniref:uncharacterized protein LOC131156515 isoform X2 n=1 Tax=Malania oleifera TaxID=397392 RepID=UPI0025AE6815|nr:uncharacterized protein LOC131156515 isoform X2 [Malania oleifera]XP_057966234.1 uncharacterized protein LOC131156515 isoform X2 [Malania oleifera]XP_057966235.1 uncharacterized protein LOC131156515 isoform X2 [Malania oleifera]
MSVFGGDSWAREAQHRKRRVDDLVVEALPASSYKKLSNGKYACLVCPHNPILDSSLMLSMHCKGSRHRASESKLKEREIRREDEIKKRIALSGGSVGTANVSTYSQQFRFSSKPLIEQTRKAIYEMPCSETIRQNAADEKPDVGASGCHSFDGPSNYSDKSCFPVTKAAGELVAQQQLDFLQRRERELKFTAAGWKRDCHGVWFRDENVEFDSDEEDPNVCIA